MGKRRAAAVSLVVAVAVAMIPVAPAAASRAASCDSVTPVATAPVPHEDGRYTPIVLVHGFRDDSSVWSKPATWSAFSNEAADGLPLVQALGSIPGAAVYTVDYRTSHLKWFADEGGGGEEFLRVADCVLAREIHRDHKLVVVGHSMGGLIARWAMTDAPGAEQRRARAGLMVSLGTPYEGSFVAALGDQLVEEAGLGTTTPAGRENLETLHLLAATCDAFVVELAECRTVEDLLDFLATVKAFKPGSPELTSLSPWPASMRVRTATSDTVVTETRGLFRNRVTESRLGDVVVSRASATAGEYPERAVECNYTKDVLRAIAYETGVPLTDDPSRHWLLGLLGPCFHVHETQLVELTADVVGSVADELLRYEPVYAYRTAAGVGIVHPHSPHAPAINVNGAFSGIEFTEDAGHVVAVEWPGEGRARVVAIDAATGARRDFPCDGCIYAAAAGGSRIAWLQQGAVMAVDLNGTDTPAATGHRMPPPGPDLGTLDEPRLVGFANGVAYVNEDMAPGASIQLGSLTVLDSSGGARRIDADGNVAQVAVSRDGKVAFGSYYRADSCQFRETVRLVTGDGQPVETNLSGLRRYDGNTIDDLWWGRDGNLYATMASWKCQYGDEIMRLVPSSLWRLEGTTWVSVDAGPLAAVRQLTRAIKAVQLPDGTLWSEINGSGTQVASGVTWIAAPPGTPDPEIRPPGTPLPPINPAFEPYVGYWQQIEGGLSIDANYRGSYNAGGLSATEQFELRQDGDRVIAVFAGEQRRWLYTDGQGHVAMNATPGETLGTRYFCDGSNGCWWDV